MVQEKNAQIGQFKMELDGLLAELSRLRKSVRGDSH
jgi:hypothetical protein